MPDWDIGTSRPYGTHHASAEGIIAFARELDPQPMHLDPASAQAESVGGLIGSGWQTAALNHALLRRAVLEDAGLCTLRHVESLRWPNPVRPGDTLSGTATLVARTATSATLDQALTNQRGKAVLLARATYGRGAGTPRALAEQFESTTDPVRPHAFNEARVGTLGFAGEHVFSGDEIRRFRGLYDPPEREPTVAPWHLTAQWLRLSLERFAAFERGAGPHPARGPGLGLTDVIWPAPARAGEPLRYFTRVAATRASASRPGWGILSNRCYALNAQGAVVVAFSSSVLLEGSLP